MTASEDAQASALRKLDPRAFARRFFAAGVRESGRAFGEKRQTSVTTGSIANAHGSALVRTGGTAVVCAIRGEIAEPDLREPSRGFIVPNIDLPPLCSPRYRPGAPPDEAQVLADRLRTLLTASALDSLADLCIAPGKAVWAIYIDAVVLSDDGNVVAAAAMAADAALRDARLPAVNWDSDASIANCVPDKPPFALVQRTAPLQVSSVGVFEDTVLADPDDFEEQLCTAHATVVVEPTGAIRYVQQVGRGSLITSALRY